MHSSRAGSRTGSPLPRSSNTTFRELPGDVRVVSHSEPTSAVESEMVRTWAEVTNRGGAGIGFLPPVRAKEVRPTAAELFKKVRSSGAQLVVVRRDDELLGRLAIVLNLDHTRSHWGRLKRVHVLPEARGTGHGDWIGDARRRRGHLPFRGAESAPSHDRRAERARGFLREQVICRGRSYVAQHTRCRRQSARRGVNGARIREFPGITHFLGVGGFPLCAVRSPSRRLSRSASRRLRQRRPRRRPGGRRRVAV